MCALFMAIFKIPSINAKPRLQNERIFNLHAPTLLKLKVIRALPIVIRSTPSFLRGLDLNPLKVESIVQLLYH